MTRIYLNGNHAFLVKESYNEVVNKLTVGTGTGVLELTEVMFTGESFSEKSSKVFIKPDHIVSVHEVA